MDRLLSGLSVALIGMLIVFIGLVVLIFCISLLRKVAKEKPKREGVKASEGFAEAPAAELPPAAPAASSGEGAELIAVLTAAVAALWEGEQGFVVRRVRRVHLSPAWEKAGREEQIYSRM